MDLVERPGFEPGPRICIPSWSLSTSAAADTCPTSPLPSRGLPRNNHRPWWSLPIIDQWRGGAERLYFLGYPRTVNSASHGRTITLPIAPPSRWLKPPALTMVKKYCWGGPWSIRHLLRPSHFGTITSRNHQARPSSTCFRTFHSAPASTTSNYSVLKEHRPRYRSRGRWCQAATLVRCASSLSRASRI